jgi:hypothetical protein
MERPQTGKKMETLLNNAEEFEFIILGPNDMKLFDV